LAGALWLQNYLAGAWPLQWQSADALFDDRLAGDEGS
jgi:hypothetical protein